GGVGTAVLQLCRAVDELVIFGTASAAKHDVLRAEGCTYPIDYRAVDYATEIRKLTGGEGVDVVLDPLGGKDWRKGLKLQRAGRLRRRRHVYGGPGQAGPGRIAGACHAAPDAAGPDGAQSHGQRRPPRPAVGRSRRPPRGVPGGPGAVGGGADRAAH